MAEIELDSWLEAIAWETTGVGGAIRGDAIDELRHAARTAVVDHIERTWLGGPVQVPAAATAVVRVTLDSVEALLELLESMNEDGLDATVAFVDAQGVTGVAYGIDLGDEMGKAFLTSPGEDRERGGPHDESEDGSFIGYFESDVDEGELTAPLEVVYWSAS